MSGRCPWPVLAEGRDAVTEVQWLNAAPFHDAAMNRAGRSYAVAGGFLDDVGSFDSAISGSRRRKRPASAAYQRPGGGED
jgi:acyl transferase domain-containing protein